MHGVIQVLLEEIDPWPVTKKIPLPAGVFVSCSSTQRSDLKTNLYPGIPTTITTMGVNITTIVYLRVLIIQIGSTILLMVVEAQGIQNQNNQGWIWFSNIW